MKKFYMIVLACSVLLACSDDRLSRDMAKSLINMELQKDTTTYKIRKVFIENRQDKSQGYFPRLYLDINPLTEQQKKELQRMADAGLIILSVTSEEDARSTWVQYTYTLTDKGKPYVIKETKDTYIVILYTKQVQEISGLREQKEPIEMSTVEYSICTANETPFCTALYGNYTGGMSGGISANYANGRRLKDKAISTFLKYDDGWRLENQ